MNLKHVINAKTIIERVIHKHASLKTLSVKNQKAG
jgi:hypothetical protein